MILQDLSHTLSPDIPVYPGTEPPRFEQACTLRKQGFREKRITLFSHTGTHIDAPAHVLEKGKTLDCFPADHFLGEAVVIRAEAEAGSPLPPELFFHLEKRLEKSSFLLLRTGWNRYWGKPDYFSGYPVLSREAASWLCRFQLRGIGIDAISVDGPMSHDLVNHRIFAKKDMLLIENLTGLDRLPDTGFLFSCFPLKIRDADGSPVRAMGLIF